MNRATRGFIAAAVVCLTATVWSTGCDTAQAPPGIDHVPAVISDLAISPGAANVDTLGVIDGLVAIPLALSLEVAPGDAPVTRVNYAVQWQFECVSGALDVTGEMETSGDGVYVASVPLEVPPGRRGKYRVTAWAVDAMGIHSNEASSTFALAGSNQGPPAIDHIEAPSEVRPPANIRFVAEVADPDGVDHIARAEVDVPGAGTFPMSDTDTAGNNTPCDGTYSVTFSIGQATEPGPVTFTFRAFDRAGAVSESVPFTVQILE